jgi:RNase H-fold protein (predicted Holliday junction resolvase)
MKSPSRTTIQTVLAIDPGREKCGLAIACRDGVLHNRDVVSVGEMEAVATEWANAYRIGAIVLGDSTTSQNWRDKLTEWLPKIPIFCVNERGSTLEARTLYWQFHPPCGWRRFLPLSLQTPPRPVDDFAAVVLARRFFEGME